MKAIVNFQHLQKKKMTLTSDVFRQLRTLKNVVKQITKKSPFRGPFRKQHVRGAKLVEMPTAPPLPYLLITVKAIELEKMSLSNMQSLGNVC